MIRIEFTVVGPIVFRICRLRTQNKVLLKTGSINLSQLHLKSLIFFTLFSLLATEYFNANAYLRLRTCVVDDDECILYLKNDVILTLRKISKSFIQGLPSS